MLLIHFGPATYNDEGRVLLPLEQGQVSGSSPLAPVLHGVAPCMGPWTPAETVKDMSLWWHES